MLFYWPYALPAAECVLPWKMPVLTACFPVLSNFVPDFFSAHDSPGTTRLQMQAITRELWGQFMAKKKKNNNKANKAISRLRGTTLLAGKNVSKPLE